MSFALGIVIAFAMCLAARGVGFDRDRSFYPALLIAIATYDLVFAAQTGEAHTLLAEGMLVSVFVATAVLGFRKSLVWVVVGLSGHAAADVLHPHVIANPGIPAWWPAFCAGFDAAAALVLGARLRAEREARMGGIRADVAGH